MISVHETLQLHETLIEAFGGASGVRDSGASKSALERPFQTFASVDLYPDPLEKASALIESILINHPFIDGNKRTGYALMRLYLLSRNLDISASQDAKYLFVIDVASGQVRFEEILHWLQNNTVGLQTVS